MMIDSKELRKRLNNRRKWNIENLKAPYQFNNGIVQALAIIGQMEHETEKGVAAEKGDHVEVFGSAVYQYTREELDEVAADDEILKLPIDSKEDEFLKFFELLRAKPGEVLHIIRPDGCEKYCVEENVAHRMRDAMAKAMVAKGSMTEEEAEEYRENGYSDGEEFDLTE